LFGRRRIAGTYAADLALFRRPLRLSMARKLTAAG